MGVHRTPDQLKPVIIKGTQHIIASGGMANFSFPKLTAETGISAPTVYEHFKNKEDLLTSCFMEIDTDISTMISKLLKGMPSEIKDPASFDNLCWLLWVSYWNYLVADADRTVFYWTFYNSHYYTAELLEKRNKNFKDFLDFIQSVDEQFSVSSKCNIHMLVANLIDGTVAAAVKVLKGVYKNDEASVTTVYHMVFQPVFALLGIKREKEREAAGQ